MSELPLTEIVGRTAFECVKVAIARALRAGHDGPITVEVGPNDWENVAMQLEQGGRFYRLDDISQRVVIVTVALGREVRIVVDPKSSDKTFRVL